MHTVDDSYREIMRDAQAEIVEQASRFLAEVIRVETTTSAEQSLTSIRAREHRAHHHCYAFQVGVGTQRESRSSDDGEPSGSAGRPIADQIRSAGVTNVLVVVTRYFGGTKLGTGGLVRAYSTAAKEALTIAGVQTKFLTEQIGVDMPMDRYGALKRLASSIDAQITNEEFSDRARAIVIVRSSLVVPFTLQLSDILQGRGAITRIIDKPGSDQSYA